MAGRMIWLGLIVMSGAAAPRAEAASMHDEIDLLIAAKAASTSLAGPCDDATFLRRAYFDFAGRPPRFNETRKFLDDYASDKRVKLIDDLLAGPEYPRHMEERFHVLFMERRGENPDWSKFLRTSFETNKPWDQLAREIIHPVSDDETKRGAAFFHTKRLEKNGQETTDYPGLTRDVGRLFLGIDLQCAQCHDHLFIDDYKQIDFQGLYMVFSNTSIKGDVAFPALTEKPAAAKLEFVSVFDPTKRSTGPRVPFGSEFDLPPATGSAMELLAKSLPTADNRLFVRNAVNRLWFVLIGRGLVHPLDLQHGKNPPSHPELQDLLAREFVAHQFDIKWLLRELALTKTYARSSEVQSVAPPPELFAVAIERRLSAEQLLRAILIATGNPSNSGDPERFSAAFEALRPKALKAFANPPKEPEEGVNATVQGALTLLNDEAFQKLFAPQPGSMTSELAKLTDMNQLADELYLTVLIRPPTLEERADVLQHLGQLKSDATEMQRQQAIKQLVWALVASTEFSLNH